MIISSTWFLCIGFSTVFEWCCDHNFFFYIVCWFDFCTLSGQLFLNTILNLVGWAGCVHNFSESSVGLFMDINFLLGEDCLSRTGLSCGTAILYFWCSFQLSIILVQDWTRIIPECISFSLGNRWKNHHARDDKPPPPPLKSLRF